MFPQLPFGYLNNIQIKEGRSIINLANIDILSYVGNVKDLEINTSINQVVSDSKVSLLNYADSDLDLSNISIKTTTQEYKQILSSLSLSPITIESILTGEPLTDFGAFMEISTNTNLNSNTRYLTTASGCVHTFPSSPSIGDVIEMATGNFDTRINHGNSTQRVRNLSTLSTTGTDSGVVLKPYSVCQFIYVASDLWVTGYRARTINNWLSQSGTPLQTYTPSGVTPLFGSTLEGLQDGVTGFSTIPNGLIGSASPSTIELRIDLLAPYELDYIEFWGGQGNGSSNSNVPDSFSVYSGTVINPSNLLGSFSIVKEGYIKQTFNISAGGATSSSYLLVFTNSAATGQVSIMELKTFVIPSGGEIVAT